MHEESGDHYEYRQHAKANHCNSNPNVRQKPLPLHQKSGGSANISQSPMVAEGNAMMMKLNYVGQPTQSLEAAMQLCIFANSKRLASPDGIHNTSEQNRADNNRGNARHDS